MVKGNSLFSRYFPPPRYLSMPAVGFEVNEEAVRYIELVQTSSGLEVLSFDELILPAFEGDGDLLAGQRLINSTREFCVKNKLSAIRAALPDDKAYVFKIDVPYSTDSEEIRSAVEFRLEESVPIPPKEAVFDFQVIDSKKNKDDLLELSVSVLPRMVVGKYLDFFKSFGLKPVSFGVAAQAMADAVIKRGNNEGVILVNFGRQRTSLHIVHSGVVHFSSLTPVGGDSLTQAIMKTLSVDQGEAESIKRQKGVAKDKSNPDMFFSLVSPLSSIKDEITKLVEYWKEHKERYTQHKEGLNKVIMCGPEASLRGVPEYLEASSGVPIELANVWTNVASLDKYVPPITQADSLSYATVIGLALSGFNNK